MLKRIIDFFVFSNIYVAVPVTCMVGATELLLDLPYQLELLLYIYCATLFLYCFHRLYKLEKEIAYYHAERHVWAIKNRTFMNILTVVSGLGAIATAFLLPAEGLYWLIVPAVIGLAYTVPVLPYKSGFIRLRDIPFAKVHLIALVVAWVTVLLPAAVDGLALTKNVWILFTERFFFILAITIPFDLRDKKYDAENNMKTYPIVFSDKAAKNISILALLVFCVLAMLHYQAGLLKAGLIMSAIITAIVIGFATEKRSEYFYSLLLEGTMLLQFVLVYTSLKL